MLRNSTMGLVGLCVLAVISTSSRGDDPSGEDVLKEKGLRKSGSYYTLPAELKVVRMADSIRTAQRELYAAMARQEGIAKQAEADKKLIVTYTQRRMELRQQLPQAETIAERNQIAETMNDLGDRITLLAQGGDGDGGVKKEADARVAKAREVFVQRLLDMRGLVDETNQQYAELASDAEVKGALARINAAGKTKYALGPARPYLTAIKSLEKVESTIQTETVPLRGENNTFMVDVTLNGKVNKSMIFDTGAGIVLLPEDLAAKLGLKPTEDLPTVNLHVADGRVLHGKLMTLKSVRVGKFTIENVECAVLPGDAQPLLGGSFLKHFTYKLVPELNKLTLSKIEAPAEKSRPVRGGKK